MLRNIFQATCKTGTFDIETIWLARGAMIFKCVSDQTLSIVAKTSVDILRALVAARAAVSEAFWTCLLEVVGVASSKNMTCHSGNVEPYLIMYLAFVPCAFWVVTAQLRKASIKRLANSAAKMFNIRL